MRGEHNDKTMLRFWDTGSSPHARGTHWAADFGLRYPGIIPACAGNTIFPIYV